MPERTDAPNVQQPDDGDAFFIIRDCRDLFQRRLEDIARQSGITAQTAIETFSRAVGDAHDELVSAEQKDGFEQTAGLTASRISLVGNDQLELEIRIGEIANRLKGNDRIDHWRVQLRYMTLLHRPNMLTENNPLGFEPICRGLWAICGEDHGTLDQKIDVLDRLEERLQLRLPEVYMQLDKLLENHRVERSQAQMIQRPVGGKAAGLAGTGRAAPSEPDGTNAMSSLQELLQRKTGNDSTTGASANFTLSASALVMLNHLMARLNELDEQQISRLTSSESLTDGPVSARLHAIKSEDLDLPLGKPAAITLDTLSLIFEAIFAAPDLPDAVKTALGRLQIPLLKVALVDETFFSNAQHPARQLINRMARAAIGLAQNSSREHPVCSSLAKRADAVRKTLEQNTGDLSPHLAELDTLINHRDQLIQASAQAYIQLVTEHEAREASSSFARNWLNATLEKTSAPAIVDFLSVHWLRIIQTAFLEGGATGELLTECKNSISQLLSSLQPKSTAEERRQLLSQIPALLKRVNAQMDQAGISAEQRKPFLDACFNLQTAALRGRPDLPEQNAAESADETLPTTRFSPSSARTISPPELHCLARDGIIVRCLGRLEAKTAWKTNNLLTWTTGEWIRFALPAGENLCGRLCWQGATSKTVLLCNPDWGYAVALAATSLEQQLRNGQARIVSEQALFDDAAQRALGQFKSV